MIDRAVYDGHTAASRMYNCIIDTASSIASSVSEIIDNTDSSDVTIDIAENDVIPAEHIIDIDNDVSIDIASPAGHQTDIELSACPTEPISTVVSSFCLHGAPASAQAQPPSSMAL